MLLGCGTIASLQCLHTLRSRIRADFMQGGNEAILLCDSGEYCCDGNRVSFNCCDGELPPGTDYFRLQGGDDVVGSITSMGPAPTSSATQRSSSSSGSEEESVFATTTAPVTVPLPSTLRSSTQGADSTTATSRPSSASRATSSSSGPAPPTASAGGAQPDHSTNDHSSSSFGMGAIIGLAIGVAVLVLLCALIAFFLWRRHKKSKTPTLATYFRPPSSQGEIKYSDALPPGTHAPEIDSSPKASTNGTSELYGSDSYARNSTVSSMTAGAQGYSPTSMVSPVVSTGGGDGAAGRMGQIEEKDEPPPVELWGGPVYRPYRPGLENTNEGQRGSVHDFGGAQPYSGT